jgi:dTDP-4-amino-4,6-dideoxygalactose transaminase
MKIPFVDLKKQYLSIKKEIDSAIDNVINETAFIGGKYVEKFEKEFAELYGVKHCVSVANGTDSLYIIMKMLGIGPGDEVITVANSWISTSETISQVGARPVFVDIDERYGTIDETQIEKYINSNTKAIIPVHLQGQVCDMNTIKSIAQKNNIQIIEDCAQSHFSEFNGIRVGQFGIASSFSFYPGKNLGAYGDAGCILTNNSSFADLCRMFARHGALKKHEHKIEGINSRLDAIQAAILCAKMPYILKWTQNRIDVANMYIKLLSANENIVLPKIRPNSKHSFHLFVIRHENRKELMEFLKDKGIETAIHYPNILPNLEPYKEMGYKGEDFPIANSLQNKILSLPIYPEMTLEQIEYVCFNINSFELKRVK